MLAAVGVEDGVTSARMTADFDVPRHALCVPMDAAARAFFRARPHGLTARAQGDNEPRTGR